MKPNLLARVLVGVLLLCAILTLWLSGSYFFSFKQLEKLNARYLFLNNTLNSVQALAGEAIEYSKKNPAIDPLLQRYELKPKPSGAARNSPPPAAPPSNP